MNWTGPRADPWGTLQCSSTGVDWVLPAVNVCVRSDWNHVLRSSCIEWELPISVTRRNDMIEEKWLYNGYITHVLYTLCSEKNTHLCFRLKLWRFLVNFYTFVPVEREMITLQFTYLQSWWRHNCVTLHATKVYFIELLLNIIYIEFWIEFEDKILIKNLWKCTRFFCQKTDKKYCTKNKKRWTLDGFLRKLQTTGSIERTLGSGRPRSSQNVMFLR